MSIKRLVKEIDKCIREAASGEALVCPNSRYNRATNLIHGAALVGALTDNELVYLTNHVQESRRAHKHLAESPAEVA